MTNAVPILEKDTLLGAGEKQMGGHIGQIRCCDAGVHPVPGRNGHHDGLSRKADQGPLKRQLWSWFWEDEDFSECECVWYPGKRHRGEGDSAC